MNDAPATPLEIAAEDLLAAYRRRHLNPSTGLVCQNAPMKDEMDCLKIALDVARMGGRPLCFTYGVKVLRPSVETIEVEALNEGHAIDLVCTKDDIIRVIGASKRPWSWPVADDPGD